MNNNTDWLNLSVEQALKINSKPYDEVPQWVRNQVTAVLSSFQMQMHRDALAKKI